MLITLKKTARNTIKMFMSILHHFLHNENYILKNLPNPRLINQVQSSYISIVLFINPLNKF